jgi:hypothetical protein
LVAFEEYIQPFLLLVAGVGLTGILVPRITKQWQDNKTKNEIRINLIQEMSETAAYGIGKILTAIERFRDIRNEGGKHEFTPDEAVQLYKEFDNWHTKTYTIAAKLRSYFYPNKVKIEDSDFDIIWVKYTTLIMVMWELATKLYFTGATNNQIAGFLRNFDDTLRNEFRRIDWEKIRNRDINELARLSTELLAYGYAVIAVIDFSKMKISERSSIRWPSWFRSRRLASNSSAVTTNIILRKKEKGEENQEQ